MNLMQDGVPLRYPGSKAKASKLLHSLAADGYREYREGFFGSGTMFPRAAGAERIWLNDMNPLLMRFWEWFREEDDALDKMVQTAHRLRDCSDLEIEREFVRARAHVRQSHDPLSFWVLNRFAAAAIVSLSRKDIASTCSAFRRNGMNAMRRERLEALRAQLRMPGVQLTCGDYRPLLHKPGEAVWIYLDPPYLLKDHCSPIYEYAFTPKQHVALAHELRRCPHAWMLSNGDSPFIRRLYKGFRIRHRRYTGSMPHREPDRFKTEVIITCY